MAHYQSLEEADDIITSGKILDLPPELRVRIYQWHYDSLGHSCDGPLPPPITRVCSLIRHESLPLFFACKKFSFIFRVAGYFERMSSRLTTPAIIEKHPTTRTFLKQMPTEWYGMLRHVHVEILGTHSAAVDIHVGKNGSPSTFEISHHRFAGFDASAVQVAQLEKRVSELVKDLNARGEGQVLGKEQLKGFMKVLQDMEELD